MIEILACPECGDVPEVGYACGEYFIMSAVHPVGECFCGNFTEMHSSEEKEIEVWNEAVKVYCSNREDCEACCQRDNDSGYCLDRYNGNKKVGQMTDAEIIKAYELCFTEKGTTYTCAICPYHSFGELCKIERDKDALDLINRQKVENERLQKEIYGTPQKEWVRVV